MANKAEGIDVSSNNGVFDWSSWNGHIEFGMAKATEGETYSDPQFQRNWASMKAIRIHRFAYHYAHPDENPSLQAQHFVKAVLDAGWERGDGLVMDLEKNPYTGEPLDWGRTPQEIAFWAWTFMTEVDRIMRGDLHYEYHLFLYADRDIIELGWAAMMTRWGLWIADYGVAEPRMPVGPFKSWYFWQRTGGPVDLDVFNGTAEQLQTFVSWPTVA